MNEVRFSIKCSKNGLHAFEKPCCIRAFFVLHRGFLEFQNGVLLPEILINPNILAALLRVLRE